jgi:hypothetical protein
MHPEVLERVQTGPRLRDEQCNEGQDDDRLLPGSDQGSYLRRERMLTDPARCAGRGLSGSSGKARMDGKHRFS